MNRNIILGSAVVVITAAVAGVSLSGSSVAKTSFADLPKSAGNRCEVYGKLDRASIHPIQGATVVSFTVRDEKTNEPLEVLYQNPNSALPANFPAATHAKLGGVYDPVKHQFVASTVSTKCPSKYDAGKVDLAEKDVVEKWQRETGLKSGA